MAQRPTVRTPPEAEPVECASPPCLAGEVDPAYMGLLAPDQPKTPAGPAPSGRKPPGEPSKSGKA